VENPACLNVEGDAFLSPVAHPFNLTAYLFLSSITAVSAEAAITGSAKRSRSRSCRFSALSLANILAGQK
jgi:hypothetical protein